MKKKLSAIALSLGITFFGSMSALAAPMQMADGTVFDPVYYATKNPDVVKAFGTSTEALYLHYTTFGKNEGRLPYEAAAATSSSASSNTAASSTSSSTATATTTYTFDPAYYAAKYPDLLTAFGYDKEKLTQHYLTVGKAEGRYGSQAEENAVINAAKKAAEEKATSDAVTDFKLSKGVYNLMNAERNCVARTAYDWSETLATYANIRVKDLVTSYSHNRPNGSSYEEYLTDEKVVFKDCGELIARGTSSAEDTVDYWMEDVSKRLNILSTNFSRAAVGHTVSNGTHYWVALFISK